MTTDAGCGHEKYGAKLGCNACVQRVRAKYPEFPLQMDRDTRIRPGPLSVPWAVADKAWAAYHQRWGSDQSVERLAERGGFGWGEMDTFFPDWREATDEWVKLRAQVAALTAERDAALAECDGSQRGGELCGACAGCVRLFRERMQALQARDETTREAQDLIAQAAARMRRGETSAEERLSAILQRREIWKHVHSGPEHAAARAALGIVVGEDGTGAGNEPLHCCGTTTDEHPDSCPMRAALAPLVEVLANPEPSTAEAFATVREALDIGADNMTTPTGERAMKDAITALSLLERRMGAAGRAVRRLADAPPREWLRLFQELQASLTDTPPVFTLEEVRAAMLATGADADAVNEGCERLAALQGGSR